MYSPCTFVRFDDPRDVMNSPLRIPTVRFSWWVLWNEPSTPPQRLIHLHTTCDAFLNTSRHKLPMLLLVITRRSYTSWALPPMNLSENPARTPCGRHSTTSQVLNLFDPAHTCSSSPSTLTQVRNLELHSACTLLARLLCPTSLVGEWEQKLNSLSLLSIHSLQELQLR